MNRMPGMRGSRAPGMGLLLLGTQMAQVGFNNIPPVTLAAIAGQVAIYLKLFNIRWPSIGEVCISPFYVWYRHDWERLLFSAFFHADEWHLYFNMMSMLWKGRNLEPRLGSGYFVYLIAVFTVLNNGLYVALGLAAEQLLHDSSYLSSCAVGFSGVLFALKVVATHMSPGVERVMGFIPVPSRYACWAELLLIHVLVPRASFIGHLSGILIGLLYIKGPLKPLMDYFIPPNPGARNYARPSLSSTFSRYRDWATSSSGDQGGRSHQPSARNDSGYHDLSSHQYTAGMSEEEQTQHAMRQSLRQDNHNTGTRNPARPEPSAPPMDHESHMNTPPYPTHSSPHQPSLYPDLSNLRQAPPQADSNMDELRRRRLQRFDG